MSFRSSNSLPFGEGGNALEGQYEALLSAIVESSDDAIISKSLDGTILSWNRGAEILFGYTAEEAIGRSIRTIIPEELHGEENDIQSRLVRGERVQHFETTRLRKDGNLVTVSLTVSPIVDRKGNIVGASKIARDITERKKVEFELARLRKRLEIDLRETTQELEREAEITERLRISNEQLELSRERMRVLIQAIPQLVWTSRADGEVDYLNPQWLAYTGLSQEESIGQGWIEVIHPEDLPALMSSWRSTLESGEEFSIEVRLRNAEGKYHWFLAKALPYRDETGEIRQWYGTCTDIQEQKEAEVALAGALARVNAVLSSITDSYFALDKDFRFVEVNETALSNLFQGKKKEELLGKVFWEVYPKERESIFLKRYEQALKEQRVVEFEARSRISGRWFEVHLYPRAGRLEVYARDITERRKAQELLKESDRHKDEFLALLGHELRNPLAAVVNGIELLDVIHGSEPESVEIRSMMKRQARQITRLIDDLLDVSRISRGKIVLRPGLLDLRDVVLWVAEERAFKQGEQGEQERIIDLNLPAEPVPVFGDQTRLIQILSNLMHNAYKFTEPGGTIEVSLERRKGSAVISVRDDGIGMSKTTRKRLFQPFVQANEEHVRLGDGLGLGLALVKGLVDLHHGTVTARSRGLGKGSEFIVELPLAEGAYPAPEAGRVSRPRQDRTPLNILLVEDSPSVARLFGLLLEKLGNSVVTAYSGKEALRALESFSPDVVFSDIRMPGIDGHELARRIRESEKFRDIVLIATTGFGQPEDRQRSFEAGFDFHLVKPANRNMLGELLGKVRKKLEEQGRLPGGQEGSREVGNG